MSCTCGTAQPREIWARIRGAAYYTHENLRDTLAQRHPHTIPEGRMAMSQPDQPLPRDDELIDRIEQMVYHVRLAKKSGEPADLHAPDMRPVVLLRMLLLATTFICAMADYKKLTYSQLKAMFADMRIAERKARQ